MEKKLLFLLFACLLGFTNCNEDGELDLQCVTDIAVEALSAPGRIALGDFVGVVCILKNVASTIDNCNDPTPSSSGQGMVRVSRAFSETEKQSFSEYELLDSEIFSVRDLAPGQEFIDENMEIVTSRGRGFYAMKVEALHPDDTNPENDARAVAIEVY